MIRIVPYRRFALRHLRLRADFAFTSHEPDPETSFCLLDGWREVACGGYACDRPGVFTLWGAAEEGLSVMHWLAVKVETRRIIDDLMAAGARRVHAYAYASDARAVGFLTHLGLNDERHILTAFGPNGADFLLAARLGQIEGGAHG